MKKHPITALSTLCTLLLLSACGILPSQQQKIKNESFPAFSYEGHRGARGLYPENSIGAMKTAIDVPKIGERSSSGGYQDHSVDGERQSGDGKINSPSNRRDH